MINNINTLVIWMLAFTATGAVISFFVQIYTHNDNNLKEVFKRFKSSIWGISCLVSFVLCIILSQASISLTSYLAKKEINSILNAKPEIYVKQNNITNDSLLNALLNIKENSGRRDWNDSVIYIRLIKNKKILELKAEKNKEDSTLYRIYYPKYDLTRLNAIGEIKTKSLSNY